MTVPAGGWRHADGIARVHAVFRRYRPVDLDTNFFEGGFSSALLAEVLAGLRELGLDVSLTDLYRYPTVRELYAAGGSADRPAPATPPWLTGRTGHGGQL
jgi:aryl carrier-like protein